MNTLPHTERQETMLKLIATNAINNASNMSSRFSFRAYAYDTKLNKTLSLQEFIANMTNSHITFDLVGYAVFLSITELGYSARSFDSLNWKTVADTILVDATNFSANTCDNTLEWLNSLSWVERDSSVLGLGRRIARYLNNGIPSNSQMIILNKNSQLPY